MAKIKSLSPEIVATIAAGEVIEKPANVIKELVENAIDAQANQIKVLINNSGLEKIVVTDNGEGMDEADLQVCYLPHTTSKISSREELFSIKSFGFRGEALASIAQISHLSIKSKTPESNLGYELKVKGGRLESIKASSANTGTMIIVENLFYSVPVRKKFLKNRAIQLRHIIKTLSEIALAYPEISFYLSHNQKTIFDLPSQNLEFRTRAILGNTTFVDLLPLNYDDPYLKIHGFLGKPQVARKLIDKQYLFVNQRPVKNLDISKVIKKAFHGLISKDNYPSFVLFIELPFENVDINVHPQKQIVKFLDDQTVLDLCYSLAKDTLFNANLSYQANYHSSQMTQNLAATKNTYLAGNNAYNFTKQVLLDNSSLNESSDEIILQINQTYLIKKTTTGLMIIDQHAASERIWFEKLQLLFQKKQLESHKLAKPILIETSLEEADLVKDNLKLFEQLGIVIETFYKNNFKVISIPEILKNRNLTMIINDVIDDLSLSKENISVDKESLSLLEFLACRSAIKANTFLTQEQRQELVQDLIKCQNPYTCPHGRPTIITYDDLSLQKMFKRV